MENLPPPQQDVDALAARLAALSARRAGPASTPPPAGPVRAAAQRPVGARVRRRHPAQRARVAALGLSIVSTGGLATLFAVNNAQTGNEVQAASIVSAPAPSAAAPLPDAPAASATTAVPAPTPAPAVPSTSPAPSPAPAPASNTVVDGAVFRNKWGNVQVEATFAPDGSLVDVTTLQTPFRDGKSVRINDVAVPRLNAEALTAQSASVHTVSGATYTSNDYERSLQSAIDAARLAGITTIG